jgi:hypothetical protein
MCGNDKSINRVNESHNENFMEKLFAYSNFLFLSLSSQNNGAQQLASEATVYIMLEDVNDEIPLFTEREQETVLEGEPIGTKVTQVNAIDKDGTFPNNRFRRSIWDPGLKLLSDIIFISIKQF